MEKRPSFDYCQQCRSSRPILEIAVDGVPVRRCRACGSLMGPELTLESGPTEGREVKILFVYDDVHIRETLGDILRFRGYKVITAPDGESGLAAVAREHPDLVLLNMMISETDSFEVCRRLKADPEFKRLPVIILTDMNDPGLNRRAFEAGATLAFSKTADTATMLLTIEAALSRKAVPPGEPPAEAAAASAGQPRPTLDLAVPVQSATFLFWTVDGLSFEGTLALHLNAEKHPGMETILDRLNDPNLFLPLRVSDDLHVVFLNKIQIVRVDASHGEGTPVDPEHVAETNTQPIKVRLINGEQLQGTVRIDGPIERRRLSDFLNTQPAFLPLVGPEKLHLLRKRYIVRVEPQRP